MNGIFEFRPRNLAKDLSTQIESKVIAHREEVKSRINDRMTLKEMLCPQFPLARIKKIMKEDLDVQMISSDAPYVLAKTCEFFIAELAVRAFEIAKHLGRELLTTQDVLLCIMCFEDYDFVRDCADELEIPLKRGSNSEFGKAMKIIDSICEEEDMNSLEEYAKEINVFDPFAYNEILLKKQKELAEKD
ncbi:hypothetical protein PCE1_001559 [Barthelona sp. PCE]